MIRRYFPLLVVILAIALYEGKRAFQMPSMDSKAPSESPENVAPAADGESIDEVGERSDRLSIAPAAARDGSISRGTSFYVEMQRAGVSPVDIHHIVKASRDVFNLKKVRPGQKYSLYVNPAGQLDSLHFVVDAERVLKISRLDEQFVARQDTTAYEIEHYVTSGTIHNSIYATLQEQGSNPELASYLAVIFQWDIDFFTDIRRGDSFTILYENKVFADGRTELGNVRAARIFTRGKEHYAVAYTDKSGRRSYYDERGNSLQKSLLKAPLRYTRISSNFTRRRLHPVTHTYKAHLGVDYVAPRGTAVRSTGDGTVVAATRNRANGRYVKIKHNSRYTTYYLHLQGFAKGIRRGARVRQGQVIGYLGSSGLVTAAHLDYRIKVGGRFVNPRTIKLPSKTPVPADEMTLFEISRDGCLLRFFEASQKTRTMVVEEPRPPLQRRMAVVI
jgi:murein DD-endopeptidase MepM/ murein hydrolase activator NlpD